MPNLYFDRFPTIQYANVECKDLTRRVGIHEKLAAQAGAFYPYDVSHGLRADHIADAYYGDPNFDWLIWLSTEIIDPYYGWPLEYDVFNQFIADKYGSIEDAQQRVKFWRIQWESEYKRIAPEHFNALPDPLKKYWTPLYDETNAIDVYQRKECDYTVHTNKIVRFTFESVNGAFQNTEFIDIKFNGGIVGTGEVYVANSTDVFVYHVQGEYEANSTHVLELVGEMSAAEANTITSNLVAQPISNDEIAYWGPVSMYDYENEINEQRKTIIALRKDLAGSVVLDVTRKLGETE